MHSMCIRLLFAIFLFSKVLSFPDQYMANCNRLCTCNRTTIICQQERFNSTDIFLFMRHEVYEYLDTLIVTGNRLGVIDESNLFGIGVEHNQLTKFDLQNNGLISINARAFEGMPQLEEFDLSFNNLHRIDGDLLGYFPRLRSLRFVNSFSTNNSDMVGIIYRIFHESRNTFSNLKHVELDLNGLMYLPEETFCKLPALTMLSLRSNHLTNFRFSKYCFPVLQLLDLGHNRLQKIGPDEIFIWDDGLSVVNSVDISENPFICDCYLKNFIKFLWRERDLFVHGENTLCVSAIPNEYKHKSLFKLDANRLSCTTEVLKGGSQSGHLIIAMVTVIMIFLIGYFIYRSGTMLLMRTVNAKPKYNVVGGYHKLQGTEQESVVSDEFV